MLIFFDVHRKYQFIYFGKLKEHFAKPILSLVFAVHIASNLLFEVVIFKSDVTEHTLSP